MSDYDQTKGELCPKCGWAMKFPEEPCRCELERENAALREDRDRLVKTASEVLEAFILHKKVETGHPCPENMCICIDLRAAIDAARAKEGQL